LTDQKYINLHSDLIGKYKNSLPKNNNTKKQVENFLNYRKNQQQIVVGGTSLNSRNQRESVASKSIPQMAPYQSFQDYNSHHNNSVQNQVSSRSSSGQRKELDM
jgi:hypothetical protein